MSVSLSELLFPSVRSYLCRVIPGFVVSVEVLLFPSVRCNLCRLIPGYVVSVDVLLLLAGTVTNSLMDSSSVSEISSCSLLSTLPFLQSNQGVSSEEELVDALGCIVLSWVRDRTKLSMLDVDESRSMIVTSESCEEMSPWLSCLIRLIGVSGMCWEGPASVPQRSMIGIGEGIRVSLIGSGVLGGVVLFSVCALVLGWSILWDKLSFPSSLLGMVASPGHSGHWALGSSHVHTKILGYGTSHTRGICGRHTNL